MGSHEKVEHDGTSTSEIPVRAGYVEPAMDTTSDGVASSPMDILKTIPVTNGRVERTTWLAGAVDRLLRTTVQTLVGYTTVSGMSDNGGFNLFGLFSVVLAALIMSTGTSLISFPSVNDSWAYQITERAVKTFIQSFLSGMVAVTVGGVTFTTIPLDYKAVLVASGVAAVTSVLTSIVSTNIGSVGTVDVVLPLAPTPKDL